MTQGRRLSKTRRPSSAAFEVLNRRTSGLSEDSGGISRTSTTLSTSSTSTIDWKSRRVEGSAPLESDPQLLWSKTPYIVVTSDYIVKLKSHADALAMFPQLGPGTKADGSTSTPEPLLTIPIASVVSLFIAESTRPSFGMEVWWRPPASLSFHHASFFFNIPTERQEQMAHILRAMGAVSNEVNDLNRYPVELVEPLRQIHSAEEPNYQHQKLEVFPVVMRGKMRRERDENGKKSPESPSTYLVVGANLCYLVEAHRAAGKRGEVVHKHRTFGLVTLESLRGDWVPHQERFNITFRDPFNPPVTLELASRFYRRIIRVFGKADRFLKPAWPIMWRTLEIFRIAGLREPHYLVPGEDFGSAKRTLDAYLAAYRCEPVEWEINWKTQFFPEFRLLPAQNGVPYSALQILAVLRALRYNDFFSSLSFRGINLAVLWNWYDNAAQGPNVAYLDRNCFALNSDEVDVLRMSPVLYQEFHALAFCSGQIRQIDFTDTFSALPTKCKINSKLSVQFLTPILKLLQTGDTRCSHLLLSGCALTPLDLDDIAETLKRGAIQGLDISRCGLQDMELRGLLDAASFQPQFLQSLNVSNNTGRFPASIVPDFVAGLSQLRELNLSGSLRSDVESFHEGFQGDIEGPLIHFETLVYLPSLEVLDLSKYKLNEATVLNLEEFLIYRSSRLDNGEPSAFRQLVLNNCGVNGRQAAQLFSAIGINHGIHLFLSGNPLEDGIEYMAEALRHHYGPAGLTMEMIELRSERKYCDFVKALTTTKYLHMLSLVGTSPTLPSGTSCHQQTMLAMEEFFAYNTSLRYLDMSGFSGRLDDGQLAKGFGHSLIGLTKNTTLAHLRIRNQNLHEDAGTLGTVISENSNLRVLDCQDNNFNMTSLQFLANSIKDNFSIVDFSFPKEEQERIWRETLAGLRRRNPPAPPKKDKNSDDLETQETMLRGVFEQKLGELERYLERNREAREHATGQSFDYEAPAGIGSEGVWSRITLEVPVSGPGAVLPEDPLNRPTSWEVDAEPRRPVTIRSSAMAIDTSNLAPYHVSNVEGNESPAETLGALSEVSTPPELVSPRTPEDESFQKALEDLAKTGFGTEE
ncbi:RNI-like protein [Thozetella sp. PMI_491]|nr:RNI-like protein [Thozetella sp. PMI_491]